MKTQIPVDSLLRKRPRNALADSTYTAVLTLANSFSLSRRSSR